MLQLILGRAGYGKSTEIRRLLKTLSDSGASEITYIVPEQASFSTERDVLKLLGEKKSEAVDVLSFTRLAENVLSEFGGKSLPKIDDGGRALLMSMAIRGVTDKLNIYKNHGNSVPVISEFLKISEETKRCDVKPSKLLVAAGAMSGGVLKNKLNEISIILEAYNALLAQNFDDDNDLLSKLYDVLPQSGYFKNRIVVIDEFSGFTRQEYKIIECMLSQAQTVYVTLCTDEVYESKTNICGPFTYIIKTASKLFEAAKRANSKIAENIRLNGDERVAVKPSSLVFLEQNIYSPVSGVFDAPARDIVLCAAGDVYDECAFVASEIKRLLREENYRCRDIAVISRSGGVYETSVRAALKKCGVPVFEDKRQPVVNQPLIILLRTAMEISAMGFSCDRVMRYLKTGLTGIVENELNELENYALMWQINGDRWLCDWNYNPSGYGREMTQEDCEYAEKINEIRRKVVAPLERLRRKVSDTNGAQIAKSLFELLEEVNAQQNLKELAIYLEDIGEQTLSLEQERLWDITMEMLDMIYNTLGDFVLSPRNFLEMLDIIISTRTLGNIPQGLDEVAIGSADRIITSSPRAVFVVGANDGVFPAAPIMHGLLSDSDRKKLKDIAQVELFDFAESRVASERFLVYKSLCCSYKKLYVSYAAVSSSGSETSQSEFVTRIKRMFPNCERISSLDSFSLPEGISPAFEALCAEKRRGGEKYDALRAWFAEKSEYSSRLEALDRASDGADFEIKERETAEKLFGKNLYISASKAETFFSCPFGYFCKYGLLAKPRGKAEFDSMQQGSEIHFVLETILRRFGRDELMKMTPDERYDEVKTLLDTYLRDKLGGEDKTKRFDYLYLRLAKTISEILERLVAEFSKCSFVPVDFELKINRDGDIMPYEITLDDGSTVSVCGSVDRVDKYELDGKSYVRVIDYKSGGKSFRLSEVMNGLNIQMLLYLFAIWTNGEARYGDIVPSGVLYMPASAKFASVKRTASEDEIKLEKNSGMRMNGILLNNEIALLGMENPLDGVFVPAEYKKDTLSGSLISLKQLVTLKDVTDKLLRRMAEQLHSGKISAYPVEHKCDYCDYKSVCGHESDSPVKEIQSINNENCLKILDEKKEAAGDGLDN